MGGMGVPPLCFGFGALVPLLAPDCPTAGAEEGIEAAADEGVGAAADEGVGAAAEEGVGAAADEGAAAAAVLAWCSSPFTCAACK